MRHSDFDTTEDTTSEFTPPGGEEATLPLGVGEGMGGADPLVTAGSTSNRFKSGSFVLIIVIVTAIAGLYSMRTLARVTAGSGGDANIEKRIEDFMNSWIGEGKEPKPERSINQPTQVITVLKDNYTELQVPLADVQKNPFILMDTDGGGPTLPPSGATIEQRRQLREQTIRNAAERFRLKTVMMGNTPLANLDGKIVRVGDKIPIPDQKIDFRVAQITRDSVSLVADDAELELSVTITLFISRGP